MFEWCCHYSVDVNGIVDPAYVDPRRQQKGLPRLHNITDPFLA